MRTHHLPHRTGSDDSISPPTGKKGSFFIRLNGPVPVSGLKGVYMRAPRPWMSGNSTLGRVGATFIRPHATRNFSCLALGREGFRSIAAWLGVEHPPASRRSRIGRHLRIQRGQRMSLQEERSCAEFGEGNSEKCCGYSDRKELRGQTERLFLESHGHLRFRVESNTAHDLGLQGLLWFSNNLRTVAHTSCLRIDYTFSFT